MGNWNDLNMFCESLNKKLGSVEITTNELYESLDVLSEKDSLSNIEKKVLIFSNLDTSLFRTVKPSYQPKEDLDYWIHLRIFKDSVNSLGVTKPVTQNQFARGVIDTTQYFSTIPPENMEAAIDKTRMRWTTAMSDVGTNPDLTKLFPVGVQSIPISIVSLDSTEKKLLHLWNNSCWKVKPKALRFAIPPDSVPSEPSEQLNAQGGNITSPSL
jgi:hypothetical protein